jgi:hypothetical protein
MTVIHKQPAAERGSTGASIREQLLLPANDWLGRVAGLSWTLRQEGLRREALALEPAVEAAEQLCERVDRLGQLSPQTLHEPLQVMRICSRQVRMALPLELDPEVARDVGLLTSEVERMRSRLVGWCPPEAPPCDCGDPTLAFGVPLFR